jgi:hypothetical protein
MRILTLDCSGDSKEQQWTRQGTNIKYEQNGFKNDFNNKLYYSLKFDIRIESGERTTYFAHSVPYTYSMLMDYLG